MIKRHHYKDHGPSMLARYGLLAIVQSLGDHTEIGRHHFDASAVSKASFNDDQSLDMTVDVTEPLIFTVPKDIDDGGWGWIIEMRSGDGSLNLRTFAGSIDVKGGETVRVVGPLKFTVPAPQAHLLTRTHRDTDRSDAPPFRYEDDDDE